MPYDEVCLGIYVVYLPFQHFSSIERYDFSEVFKFLRSTEVKNKNLKKTIHQALVNELTDKVNNYGRTLESMQQSKNNDTKSSAGDKFETGREMMQMEIDKTEMQLNKVNFALETLNQIKNVINTGEVVLGSLVRCNTGSYYISIGHGSIKIDGKKYYAISMISPVGKLLMGKKSGDTLIFNGRTIEIIDVE